MEACFSSLVLKFNRHMLLNRPWYLIILALAVSTSLTRAQWATDPYEAKVVCDEAETQRVHQIFRIKQGGTTVVWEDRQLTRPYRLFAQRYDRYGWSKWKTNGILVAQNSFQKLVSISGDEVGGLFVFFLDTRKPESRLMMQHLDSSGSFRLNDSGVAVIDFQGSFKALTSVNDGNGGVILAWAEEGKSGSVIYSQRVSENGERSWPSANKTISISQQKIENIALEKDERGGFIVIWSEVRIPESQNSFYAQRIDLLGDLKWLEKGVICDTKGEPDATNQRIVMHAPDGTGGSYFVINEKRRYKRALFFQHIDSTGAALLPDDGQLISDTTGNIGSWLASLCSSGDGSVYVSWQHWPNNQLWQGSLVMNLYGRKGISQWPKPIVVDSVQTSWRLPLVSDESNGVVATILRENIPEHGIYVQRFNIEGKPQWGLNSVYFSQLTYPPALGFNAIPDGSHGMIASFSEPHSGKMDGVFIQQISGEGLLGSVSITPPNIDTTLQPSPDGGIRTIAPNPTSGLSTIVVEVPSNVEVNLDVYNVLGELIFSRIFGPMNRNQSINVQVDLTSQSSGTFYCRLTGPYIDETKMLVLQR